LQKAFNKSPTILEFDNLLQINQLQKELDIVQNSGLQISFTGNYHFTPYFNNSSGLITTTPDPNAIGYDIALTDGGLYSAQVNFSKNIFNSLLLDILDEQNTIQSNVYSYDVLLEKHNLEKQITEQYLNTLQSLLQINLSEEVLSNLESQLNMTGKLVENGYVKEQDFLLLKVECKNQKISADELRQQYQTNLYQLYALCGINDAQIVKIDSINLKLINTPSISNFYNKYYFDSVSNINQQRIFETKYRPQFEIFFNAGLNAVELKNIQRKFGFSAGLNFSYPIFDGNQKDITRQQRLLNQKTINENKEYFLNIIENQRRNSDSRITTLENNLKNFKEQIKEYGTIIEIEKNQLQHGNITMIEYLTLLKNFIEIRKNLIITEINYQIEINNHNYWNW
jgi:outer membrane protein TolC